MVFGLIDRIIGHDGDVKYYLKDHSALQLQELGFNEEEAQQLAWLQKHHGKGFYYGLASGAIFLYFVNPFYNQFARTIPYLSYQPHVGFFLKASTLAAFCWAGSWASNSKRHGANFGLANMYSNNNYTKSKEAFLKNFEVLNRSYTQDEVDQFLENRVRERKGQERKWIYNPHLHGDNEEEFRKNIDLYFKKNVHPSEKEQAKKDIQNQNSEKIQQGETVQKVPYNLVKDVSADGTVHKIKDLGFSKYGAWTALE